MRPPDHPHYSELLEWEREFCGLLTASGQQREALPFRADSKIFEPVIVAAECARTPGAILVVSPPEYASSWVSAWSHCGRRGALRQQSRPTGTEAVVTTVEEIQRAKRSFQTVEYSVILLAAGLSEQEADQVISLLSHHYAWWMVDQAESHSWALSPAGRSLYLEHEWQSVALEAGPRGRLSGLAVDLS